MRIKVQKWVVAFFCMLMTMVSTPLLAQQTGKSIERLVYSPVRQGGGDVLAISWRTDFKASLASAVLTADSGQSQHLQLKH